MRILRFAACDLGLGGGGVLLGDDIVGPETVFAIAGARLERILGGILFAASVVRSIADEGRGGPSTPAEAARGGAGPAVGGGALETLIPGEAV